MLAEWLGTPQLLFYMDHYMTSATEDQWIVLPDYSAGGSPYHRGSGLTRGVRVQFAEQPIPRVTSVTQSSITAGNIMSTALEPRDVLLQS